jgi:hypothetical protein
LSAVISPASSTISCTVTPDHLQFYGAGGSRNAEVLVKCTTSGPNASLTAPASRGWEQLLSAGTCLAIFFAGWNKRGALVALLAAAMLVASCGGGAGGTTSALNAPPPAPSTGSTTGGSSGGTTTGTTGGSSGGTTGGTSGSTGGTTGGTTASSGGSPSTAPGVYTVSLVGSPKPITSSPMTLVVH